MLLQEDLTQIAREYQSYFPKLFFVEKQKTSSFSYIALQTLEGQCMSVSVCEKGWFILHSDKYYDTFEALMNIHSPGFRDSFASNLLEKLQNMTNQRE